MLESPDDFKKKQKANHMEPIFRKLKVGDRGIFDGDGVEFFVAQKLPKLPVGAYKDRIYILPVQYLEDAKKGIAQEAGFQITAFHFANMFEYRPVMLDEQIKNAERSRGGNEEPKAASAEFAAPKKTRDFGEV